MYKKSLTREIVGGSQHANQKQHWFDTFDDIW